MIPITHTTIVVGVVGEFWDEGVFCEKLFAEDSDLMGETVEGLWNKIIKWKK